MSLPTDFGLKPENRNAVRCVDYTRNRACLVLKTLILYWGSRLAEAPSDEKPAMRFILPPRRIGLKICIGVQNVNGSLRSDFCTRINTFRSVGSKRQSWLPLPLNIKVKY